MTVPAVCDTGLSGFLGCPSGRSSSSDYALLAKLQANSCAGREYVLGMHVLIPKHLPALDWMPEVRAGLTVYDALGAAVIA